MWTDRALVLVAAAALAGGCAPEPTTEPPTPTIPAESTATSADVDQPLVLFLGDSLTAGYGLGEELAFPAVVGERLADQGLPVRVVNAGVSGDTTAGGLARLDWLLSQEPDLVVVGLGANDGLRGLDLEVTEANLRAIVGRCQGTRAAVLLLGMKIPPNYGPDYFERFEAIYPEIASELEVPLVPFLLEGVAARPELNQADGIHPNARGQEIVAATVAPYVLEALAER